MLRAASSASARWAPAMLVLLRAVGMDLREVHAQGADAGARP